MKANVLITLIVFLLVGRVALADSGWMKSLGDAGVEFNGFADYRYGMRTQVDPAEDDVSLNEFRFQIDLLWYHDLFTAQLKTDLIYDDIVCDRDDIKLATGQGWVDLRQANLLASPLPWMDVRFGRQVLTWGNGDLLFINDLFPKDWQSFFLGRDDEYLKAPSDALLISMFPAVVSIDIAYTPRFDADRYISGERVSYWNGQSIVGQNSILDTERPDDWFEDDEIAARVYRNFGAYEMALYGYYGFWKSPGGMDSLTGKWIFPELGVYGTSMRGPLIGGIGNIEAGYYDSVDDRDGDDPLVNNSEARILIGYEREVLKDLTIGVQYYLEHLMDYSKYRQALHDASMPTDTARDEARHTATLRITWLLMNQNLILSCFTRYSPSDTDVYMKPSATYKISDNWQTSVGGDIFLGEDEYTFLGQFKDNNNIHVSLRYSY